MHWGISQLDELLSLLGGFHESIIIKFLRSFHSPSNQTYEQILLFSKDQVSTNIVHSGPASLPNIWITKSVLDGAMPPDTLTHCTLSINHNRSVDCHSTDGGKSFSEYFVHDSWFNPWTMDEPFSIRWERSALGSIECLCPRRLERHIP